MPATFLIFLVERRHVNTRTSTRYARERIATRAHEFEHVSQSLSGWLQNRVMVCKIATGRRKEPIFRLVGLQAPRVMSSNKGVCSFALDSAHEKFDVWTRPKRIYLLKQLKRADVDPKSLIRFYCSCIRSVLEYVCQAFHTSLLQYLSHDVEHIQKRALRIIYQHLSYTGNLKRADLETLYESFFFSQTSCINWKTQYLTVPLFIEETKCAFYSNHSLPICNARHHTSITPVWFR